jgi:hypothetical protein
MESKLEQILAKVQEGNFKAAATILAYKTEANDEITEEIEGALKLAGAQSPSKIQNIIDVYEKYGNNLPHLKNSLSRMAHGVEQNSTTTNNSLALNLTNLPDDQLAHMLSRAKAQQSMALSKSVKPDPTLAAQINALLQEQHRRSGLETPDRQLTDVNIDRSRTPESGAEHWFVLPEVSEIARSGDVRVVTGSPVISVLRERYIKDTQREVVPEFSKEALAKMGGEEQYAAMRELNKQREFVDSFKDSDRITDREVFILQAASKFSSPEFVDATHVLDKQDKFLKHYYFLSGDVRIKYDFDTRIYSIEVVGTIPGHLSIAIKKRTESGRIIDDAYVIIEFRNGIPSFLAESTKGVRAIDNAEIMKRTADRLKYSLETPAPAKIASAKEVEKLTHPSLTEPITTGSVLMPAEDTAVKPALKQVDDELPSTLRGQLSKFIAENASQHTIKYLAKQIATSENKSIEEVYSEFNLNNMNEQPQPQDDQPETPAVEDAESVEQIEQDESSDTVPDTTEEDMESDTSNLIRPVTIQNTTPKKD